MKQTPQSRIRGQNSVDKEFLDTVGSGKATGSVLKETIAVSVTISTSVQKQHSRILLRALLRGRMREMYREPEVPEAKSPSGRMSRLPCKDYLKGTCTNSFCEKWRPPVCLFYKSENGCRFGEKCSYAHRQFEEQPSKRSKKNGDKSAVAMLKKYTTIGLRISGYGAADVFINFAEELKHTETNPMCKIHQKPSCVMLTFETEIHRSDVFAQVNLISAAPMLQNLRTGLRRRQSGKSDVPVKQRRSWLKAS